MGDINLMFSVGLVALSGKRLFYWAGTRLFQLAVTMDIFIQMLKATYHISEVVYPCSSDL